MVVVAPKLGFCWVELNPLGPLHAQFTPVFEVRPPVLPSQYGPPLPATTAREALTLATVVALAVHPFASVTVNV